MEVVRFNKKIFDVLIKCGFKYCCSRTIADEEYPGQIIIILTPVKSRPDIGKFPKSYDTYFKLNDEPKQMAIGIDTNTFVYINLNNTIIKEYYSKKNTDH